MKFLNSKVSRDIECIKKENEKITKELEESKALQKKFTQQNGLIMKELGESRALNDMQQKNFTEEIRKVSNNK